MAHLESFREQLEQRATSAHHAWYELQQPQMGIYPEFEKPKIIYPHFNTTVNFAFDTSGALGNDRSYTIPMGDLYILGLLNSTVSEFLLTHLCPAVQRGYMEFREVYIDQLPIPDTPTAEHHAIEALVRQLLDLRGEGPEAAELERELNDKMG